MKLRYTMKKLFTLLFILLSCSFSLRAQLYGEFTWCLVYDTTLQRCCIQFENLSVDSGGPILGNHWDFGDGDTSNSSDPFHCYPVAATFFVYLYVYSAGSYDTVIHTLTINHLDTTDCNCDSLIGVNEISSGGFSISPNPFHDKTTLSWYSAGNKKIQDAEIRIYNSIGVLMRTENVVLDERQEFIFERKSLPTGIYYFEISGMDAIKIGQGKFLIE